MKETLFIKKTKEFSRNINIDFVKKIFVFNKLDSTNIIAKELARAGFEEGTVVIAQTQQSGRGRFNRIWQSPKGGVYISLILRPKKSIKKISLLSLVAVLAVAKTINLYDLKTTVKWPNDVQVNKKKIAGILLESEIKGNDVIYVVVGIGINLNIDPKVFSHDIQPQSTSIYHELGSQLDYHDFLRTLFAQFEIVYSYFINHQFEKIIDEWKYHTDTLGKTIRVRTTTETLQGIAVDIDSAGFLLLQTEGGEIKKILSGDCVYINQLNHTNHEI